MGTTTIITTNLMILHIVIKIIKIAIITLISLSRTTRTKLITFFR